MATSVTMPQLGETVVEGTILKWLKQEGEQIERDEPLFEISTDKVDTEVPSPVGGTIAKILVPEGETVSVGTELAQIEEAGGAAAGDGQVQAQAQAPEAEAREAPEAQQASEAQQAPEAEAAGGAAAGEPARPEGEAAAMPEPETQEPAAREGSGGEPGPPPAQPPQHPPEAGTPEPSAMAAQGGGATVSAAAPVAPAAGDGAGDEAGPRSQILSPLVRRLAQEHEIDLAQVRGTGTGGRITKKDVLAFVEGGQAQPTAAAPAAAAAPPAQAPAPAPVLAPAAAAGAAGQRDELVAMTHIRRAIAKHMKASLDVSARAWNMVEVNMENVVRVREAVKDAFKQREGISLTYTSFVARAVCDALLAFPQVNSEIRGEDLVLKHYVNLGVAVSYDEGLIVPVIKGADEMNIVGLARAVNDLATRARSKMLKPDEVAGGTFTITNPGPFGSMLSVPIISQPQTAILAFDAIEKRPVVVDDAIAIRHMCYLSMSWDHRAIDGADAAKFLARLKQNLETWDLGPELGLAPRQG
jgi:pyruvate dehydrogenase E2 component (dihydrolipoamide acetyltransferase)